VLFEPGPIAPLDPALFDRLGADRPMTALAAEAIGSLDGADVAFDTAQRELGDARGAADEAGDVREIDEAAAQLQAEAADDPGAEIRALLDGAADFERELERLGGDVPGEGSAPHYGTVAEPIDRFEDKAGDAPAPTNL
jgi:hypothetical protein